MSMTLGPHDLLDDTARARHDAMCCLRNKGDNHALRNKLQLIVDTLRASCGPGVAMLNVVDTATILVLAAAPDGVSPYSAGRRRGLAGSVCHAAIRQEGVLEIQDVSEDARFSQSSCVREGTRFFAGVPLMDTSSGRAVGTLCLVDDVKRRLTSEQRATFLVLAKQAMLVLQQYSHTAAPTAPGIPWSSGASLQALSIGATPQVPAVALHAGTTTSSIPDVQKGKVEDEPVADSSTPAIAPILDSLSLEDACGVSLTLAPVDDESRRVAILVSYGIVASEREEATDVLAQLAADICQTPISIISLIYPTGSCYKATVGLPPEHHPRGRITSFCAQAIHAPDDLLISEDCSVDDRFKHDPMVTGEPHLRLYVAAPLADVDSGHVLGTLSVADVVPRKLSDLQYHALQLLSKVTMALLGHRRREQELQAVQTETAKRLMHAEAARAHANEAIQAKANFLASMSHEIRSPLNAVLGASCLLASTELSMEQHQYVAMISTSGQMLLSIVNDILDYSKLEAGEVRLHVTSRNLVDIVEGAVTQCYTNARAKGLSLTWFVEPTLPAALLLDEVRLQQILLNLLSNAIKFTKQGGHVALAVTGRWLEPPRESDQDSAAGAQRHAERSSSPDDAVPSPRRLELHFEVHDTGIGISAANLAILFRSFSQVRHCSGEYGGTGLGLVISERLIAAMGGDKISVDSEVGRGSTFSFRIMCHPPASELISGKFVAVSSSTVPPRLRSAHDTDDRVQVQPQQPRDVYGMATHQLAQLRNLSCLVVGDVEENSVWVRLVTAYHGCVSIAPSIAAAVDHLAKRAEQHRAQNLSAESLAQALRTMVDVIIIDLDAPGVHEDHTVRELAQFSPVRLLFVSSYPHLLQAFPIVPAPRDVQRSVPQLSMTPLVPSTPASATSSLRSLAVSTCSSVHHFLHSLSSAVEDVQPTSSPSLEPAVDRFSSHSIRMNLSKPFKGSTLLQAICELAAEAFLPDSVSANVSPVALDSKSGSSAEQPATPNTPGTAPAFRSKAISPPVRQTIIKMASKCPLRILLAEDNVTNQKLMVMLLRKLGYEILVATNGVEALQLLEREAVRGREYEVECILMDASMDTMDGIECTRVIRAQQMSHRVRPFIIAQTANVTDGYREQCEQSGMDLFLAKPIQLERLIASLQAAYNAHHAPAVRRRPSSEAVACLTQAPSTP